MDRRTPRSLTALAGLALAAATLAPGASPASAAPPPATSTAPASATAPAASTATARASWTPRPEDYPATVTQTDLKIPMSDGLELRGDLTLPADADGNPVDKPVPVIVTITAYNKSVLGAGAGAVLAGADPTYLVKRGYAHLTVDARGTGSSPGQWCAFCARENKDSGEVIAWAHAQPWSDGSVGMTGASYMGISQLFAAEHRPAGLKAIFPQVPAADVYRDVVASGGQIDVGFIPLWMGLVTGTGIIPPAYGRAEPGAGLEMALDHLLGAATFTGPLMLQAILGAYPAYDDPDFYPQRSPITDIDQVDVPTFLIGGEYDLFQRGTPMVFQALQDNGVPTKMIIGPWDHLQGSSGKLVEKAGQGSLAELQLRWFDHYLKGEDTALDEIPPVTYYEQGADRWTSSQTYIGDDLAPATYHLSGSSAMAVRNGGLTTGTPQPARSTLQPLPVSGLCTRSTDQWTAGLPNAVAPDLPCFQDNRLNDASGLVFETKPLTDELRIRGPINAHLNVSSPSGDGLLAVTVEDVAPDGTVSRLTGGWQVISQRRLDQSRSTYLDGQLIRPYHPFRKETRELLKPGEIAPVDVEVFPTGAAIQPGHRLRLAVQGFDLPHLLAPVPHLAGQLAPITIYSGGSYDSSVTLPTR